MGSIEMTKEEIEYMWKLASNDPHHDFNWFDPVVVKFAKLVAEKEYERGFIDGMQKQMQSSVDKAVNAMGKREWAGLKDEPVGWINSKGNMICVKTDESCRPLYTTPQPKQEPSEPVAWMNKHGACKIALLREEEAGAKEEYTIPVYTTPQRTWVGLTVDEIAELVCNLEDPENRIELGKKIEAKLKDKNDG
jgi:hypothetical protein